MSAKNKGNRGHQQSGNQVRLEQTAKLEEQVAGEELALLGSARSYAWVQIGNQEAQLGALVSLAQAASGLSPEEWNGATDEVRDQWIDSMIANERVLVADGQPANVPLYPITNLDLQELAAQAYIGDPTATAILDGPHNDELTHAAARAAHSRPTGTAEAVNAAVEGDRSQLHIKLDPSDPNPAKTIGAMVSSLTTEKLPMADIDSTPETPPGKWGTQVRLLFDTIQAYVPAMRPKKPITPEDINRHQSALYRAITGLINRVEGEEFTAAYTWLLNQVSLHRQGVFAERYVFRGFEHLALSEADRGAFRRLLMLVTLTHDPKARAIALKQIDITKTLAVGITEQGRQRMLAYYGL